MQLQVPFLSQHDASIDPKWQKETCTIVNLAMVLAHYGKDIKTSELITEGEAINGYLGETIGWDHEAIVRLARNHGIQAYKQEFRSNGEIHQERIALEGIQKLARHIENSNPVIVSVRNNFDAERGFHTILLIGVTRDENKTVASFIYHDPDDNEREGENQRVEIDTFFEHWRRLCIFFERM